MKQSVEWAIKAIANNEIQESSIQNCILALSDQIDPSTPIPAIYSKFNENHNLLSLAMLEAGIDPCDVGISFGEAPVRKVTAHNTMETNRATAC